MDVYVVVCEVYLVDAEVGSEAVVVGVYDTEEKAEAARLVHLMEEHEDIDDTGDFDIYITDHQVK